VVIPTILNNVSDFMASSFGVSHLLVWGRGGPPAP
jgi:hypothetical protein